MDDVQSRELKSLWTFRYLKIASAKLMQQVPLDDPAKCAESRRHSATVTAIHASTRNENKVFSHINAVIQQQLMTNAKV